MLLLAGGITGEFQKLRWSAISRGSLLGLGYLIVFGSVVAFTAYTWLLHAVSADVGSDTHVRQPGHRSPSGMVLRL
jgi:drug/metabolite transporter (DMT)-like permease